ncbi:beta-galactosidase, partial [Vibrio parahaemolyticus]
MHYFRLARRDWENRLQLLKNSGFDTVATYIPWIWHELPDGDIDLTGR